MGRFPWVDFLSLALFMRIFYIAFWRGILYESVKLIGTFLASFLSLQYYSSFLAKLFGKEPFSFNIHTLNTISFFIIFFFTLFIFFFIVRGITLIVKSDRHPLWERIVAVVLGALRGSIVISTLLFCLLVFFSQKGVERSFSFRVFKKIAPVAYIKTYPIYKGINSSIKANKEVFDYYEIIKDLPRGDKERY